MAKSASQAISDPRHTLEVRIPVNWPRRGWRDTGSGSRGFTCPPQFGAHSRRAVQCQADAVDRQAGAGAQRWLSDKRPPHTCARCRPNPRWTRSVSGPLVAPTRLNILLMPDHNHGLKAAVSYSVYSKLAQPHMQACADGNIRVTFLYPATHQLRRVSYQGRRA